MGVWTNHIKANGELIGTRRETDETQKRERERERRRRRGQTGEERGFEE